MTSAIRIVIACLVILMASLLAVGVVSGTAIRHVVQVLPGVILLSFFARRFAWLPYAAMAIFAFFLFIMMLIWLFLLGIAQIVTGTFTAAEVALTVVIGLASVGGIVAAWRVPRTVNRGAQVGAFLLAAVVQVGAMWLSLQPFLANR